MNDNPTHTILVVDDERANIFLLKGLLEHYNYKVDTASDGLKCLECLEANVPDVILLDIMMPGLTGVEVLRTVMDHPEWCRIPVIMVSAKTRSVDVEEALSLGAIDYVKKPIDEIELLARLKVAIRLKENEDELRELVKAKEDFVRIISHDLRSPFSTIHGFAEMMIYDENLNEEQKDALKFIVEASNYSVEYFNKLLNWTKLGANEINLIKSDINLLKIVKACTALYAVKASEKNIGFRVDVDESLCIKADDTFFRQILNNLINNAIKFTNSDGLVSIRAFASESGLKLSVIDDGVGIKSLSPEELFNENVNTSTRGTKGEKGTGIGLIICNKIIKAHGFKITFVSTPEEGTEFIISIPEGEFSS